MLRKGKDTMSKINGEQDLDRCQVTHHHQLEYLKNRMPSQQEMEAAAELFKVFGDPTRLKLLAALLGQEMCVCDLSDLLGISQYLGPVINLLITIPLNFILNKLWAFH